MTNLTRDKVGHYSVKILLADDYNSTKEYTININIKDMWPKDVPIWVIPPPVEDIGGALSANITKISSTGLVTVKFNNTMMTNFNITLLNETNIMMYLLPSNDRHLDQDEFELESLNFTWKTVSYWNDTATFLLDWNCPSCISVEPDFDFLLVNFTNATKEGMIFRPDNMDKLHKDWRILTHKVPR